MRLDRVCADHQPGACGPATDGARRAVVRSWSAAGRYGRPVARSLSIGNGNLLINFDERYGLRDILVDGRMQTGNGESRPALTSHLGVHVEGRRVSYVDEPGWQRELAQPDGLPITECVLSNRELAVRLRVSDAVDPDRDTHVRRVTVENLDPEREREIRVVATHQYAFDGSTDDHAARLDPPSGGVHTWKNWHHVLSNGGRLVVKGNVPGLRQGVDERVVAQLGRPWSHSSVEDAADGALEGREGNLPATVESIFDTGGTVAHNTTDSATQLNFLIPGGGRGVGYLWDAHGSSREEVLAADAHLRTGLAVEELFRRARDHWRHRLRHADIQAAGLSPAIRELARTSAAMVHLHTTKGGGILAGSDGESTVTHVAGDRYNYVWPRDGALVADAMGAMGDHEHTAAFLGFCARHLEPEGYLAHKYNADGSVATSWLPTMVAGAADLPIQEDETALTVWAAGRHARRLDDPATTALLYERLIRPAATFLRDFVDLGTGLPRPSWDLWEERRGVHAFTVASVVGGLEQAALVADSLERREDARGFRGVAEWMREAFVERFWHSGEGRFLRTLYPQPDGSLEPDMAVDASLHGIHRFGLLPVDDPRVAATMTAVGTRLATPLGGHARYEGDTYYRDPACPAGVPGNPWPVCTLWHAQYLTARARTPEELRRALPHLDWVAARALDGPGMIAEQYDIPTGRAVSTSPLVWSHAELDVACLEYALAERALTRGLTTAAPRLEQDPWEPGL